MNNPGNLRPWAGYLNKEGRRVTGGENISEQFRVYDTAEEGYDALKKDINIKVSGKSSVITPDATIGDFFKIYAPSTDNNDPEAYAAFVSDTTGLDIGMSIGEMTEDQQENFAQAIVKIESPNSYLELFNEEE